MNQNLLAHLLDTVYLFQKEITFVMKARNTGTNIINF